MSNGGSGLFAFLSGTPTDVSVENLRDRIATGCLNADARLKSLLDEASLENVKLWAQPEAKQTLFGLTWISVIYWQYAMGFLSDAGSRTSQDVYDQAAELINLAEESELAIVKQESLVAISAPAPTLTVVYDLRSIRAYENAWSAYEAVYLQVCTDVQRIADLGIPKRYDPVRKKLEAEMAPVRATFEFINEKRRQSNGPVDVHSLTQAETCINQLFVTGQKFWTPYVVGQLYSTCRAKEPTLEDLELPGFGPWVFTDPTIRKRREADAWSRQQLAAFWTKVSRRDLVGRLVSDVVSALQAGKLMHRKGKGYDNIAPWPSQFIVLETVTFGTRTFSAGDLCAVYVNRRDDHVWSLEIRKAGKLSPEELRAIKPVVLSLDVWTLADPVVKQKKLQSEHTQAQRELEDLWSRVRNTEEVKQLATQLDAAIKDRKIRRRHNQARAYAPWPSQFLVRSRVRFGARTFELGDLIAAYVVHHNDGSLSIEMRRSGHITSVWDLLGNC